MSTISVLDKCSDSLNYIELYYKFVQMRADSLKLKRTLNSSKKKDAKIIEDLVISKAETIDTINEDYEIENKMIQKYNKKYQYVVKNKYQ